MGAAQPPFLAQDHNLSLWPCPPGPGRPLPEQPSHWAAFPSNSPPSARRGLLVRVRHLTLGMPNCRGHFLCSPRNFPPDLCLVPGLSAWGGRERSAPISPLAQAPTPFLEMHSHQPSPSISSLTRLNWRKVISPGKRQKTHYFSREDII